MKVFALLAAVLLAGQARAAPPELDGIGDGRPLVIEESGGGDMVEFRLRGLWLLEHHVPIVVDGMCASSCTALVDVARANVCITTTAVLAYHQHFHDDDKGKTHYGKFSYETPGLEAYLESRGGQPANKDDVLIVDFENLKRFYKPCPGAESGP